MSKNKFDLTGQTFYYWTVLQEAEPNKHGQTQWLCKCKCGTVRTITTGSLRSGKSKSCGCYKSEINTNHLAGKRFGRLTPIKVVGKNQRANVWECKCDCGNIINVKSTSLMNGTTTSCGCKMKEYQEKRAVDFTGTSTSDITVISKDFTNHAGSVIYTCKCNHCGNLFTCTDHALRQGCVHSCGCTYGSSLENEIADYIKSLIPGKTILRSYTLGKLGKYELDIYLPDYKIGIEVNGSVIHSTEGNPYNPKPKLYHRNKFLLAKDNGIRLINIFDVFWTDKLKSFLANLLQPSSRIPARKCICCIVTKAEANKFFDIYHLQGGNRNSKWHYGLYFNDELISVMSFGTKRYSKGIELIRYAVKSGFLVLGGAEKLFKHFLTDVNPDSVFTYSDNNYFSGEVYKRLGFQEQGVTTPDYYWFINHKGYYSRESCQPHKLKQKYPELYDETARSVETDIMLKLKGKRVYMCGNTRWIFSPRVKRKDNV